MTILLFIAILVVLILVHEFGHFIAAKRAGVRVDEFGIGFPPRAWGIKWGETLYSINWLPLGGFVKIFGEDLEEASKAGDDAPRSFSTQKKYVQAIILSAGVLGNILFAWVLFSVGLMVGLPLGVDENTKGTITDRKVLVIETLPDSPAALAGLLPGDQIISVTDGESSVNESNSDLITSFISARKDQALTLEYKRAGEIETTEATPSTAVDGADSEKAIIGVRLGESAIVRQLPHQAVVTGTFMTIDMIYLVVAGLGTLIVGAVTGGADLAAISGPVGIAGLVGEASALGIPYLISFTALISVNLAVINLFPFPALDGGRLLFVGIEAIRRKPIRPGVAQTLNIIGFSLLILLMILVTINDIHKLL